MRKADRRTGDHGIGRMVHVVHMTDDVPAMRSFYEDVMGGLVYMGVDEPNYLPVEDRYAALIMIGDFCVEPMAPATPGDRTRPVGRFYAKYGRHLHSVGYRVDDLEGLAGRLIDRGVRIAKPGGGFLEAPDTEMRYFFPSPRDTAGLMVELTGTDMPNDPRDGETWSSLAKMWRTHPLTIERFSHVTIGVRELEPAVAACVELLQAIPVDGAGAEGRKDMDLDARARTLQLGDCRIRLAEPLDAGSDLGRHVERCGNMIYSLHFSVRDVRSAAHWLGAHGVRTRTVRDGVLVTNPDDTFGAPIFFSVEPSPDISIH